MSNLLPPVFRETFERLRNKLLGLYIRDWLLIGALGLLAVLLIFIALDRLLYISSWVRPLFFILGCLGAFVVGPLRFYYKAYSKRSELSLAKVIKGKRKRLGDRIQGALEIAEHTSSGESRELQLAALEQIGLEAKKLDFKEVIPRLPHQVYITVIGGALMLLFLGLSLLPKQFTNASKRFFMPLSEIQRYSAIRFDELPRKHYVVIGQPSEFIVKLKENSFSEEQLIGIGKLEGYPSISEEYENGFHFLLPPIKKATTFSIETGDAYQTVKIIPRARPRIDSLSVHQYLPEYLQLEERVLNVKRKRVEVVSGSNIKLEVFSSSELKSVVSDGQLSFEHAGEKAWSNSIDVDMV